MTAEQLYALASKLEAEDLLSSDEEPFTATDIFLVLEAVDELGADLQPALDARL
jgi:hypothetical protein